MKTKVLGLATVILCLCFSTTIEAQKGVRIGYIDMDYILENVPEYREAAEELESKVQKWKVEIEADLKVVDQMRVDLNNERVLLTKELIEEREEDILFKEKEILEYQQKRFGPNGDLFLQKRRLVQPVQDQVFVAVQEIAENKKYDFIFDKSSDLLMLYSADRWDVSDQVLLRINRTAKRKQLTTKREKQAVQQADDRSVEQENEVSDRDKAIEQKQIEREKLIEERKALRDSLRNVKKKAFEVRRAKLIEMQEHKKDSLINLKEEKSNQEKK